MGTTGNLHSQRRAWAQIGTQNLSPKRPPKARAIWKREIQFSIRYLESQWIMPRETFDQEPWSRNWHCSVVTVILVQKNACVWACVCVCPLILGWTHLNTLLNGGAQTQIPLLKACWIPLWRHSAQHVSCVCGASRVVGWGWEGVQLRPSKPPHMKGKLERLIAIMTQGGCERGGHLEEEKGEERLWLCQWGSAQLTTL